MNVMDLPADQLTEARARVEILRWQAESAKFDAERSKLAAEREKLFTEALKLERERWWYPLALTIAASGATAAIIKVFT